MANLLVQTSTVHLSPQPIRQRRHIDDDSWLDSWDYTIYRCIHCNRPFGTEERLNKHTSEWHSRELTDDEKEDIKYDGFNENQTDLLPADIKLDVDLAPHGDLILRCSDHPQSSSAPRLFRVSSQVLIAASPVFDKMLNNPAYKEEKLLRKARMMGMCARVDLDDNKFAFEIIVKVLHHKGVRKNMTFKEIINLSEIADKYELADVLKPKVEMWLRPHLGVMLEQGYEDFITIFWIFKMGTEFKKTAEELAWRACLDDDHGIRFKTKYATFKSLSDLAPEILISKRIFTPIGEISSLMEIFFRETARAAR